MSAAGLQGHGAPLAIQRTRGVPPAAARSAPLLASVCTHTRIVAAPPIAATGVERLTLQPIAITAVPIVVVSNDNDAPVMVPDHVRLPENVGRLSVRRTHAISMAALAR